jgi:hypothetical protein
MVFNNVTSLPLLLLSSLGDTGTLAPLMGDGDDMDELLSRGKVYLLIHALVCNLTRFGFGPCEWQRSHSHCMSRAMTFALRNRIAEFNPSDSTSPLYLGLALTI